MPRPGHLPLTKIFLTFWEKQDPPFYHSDCFSRALLTSGSTNNLLYGLQLNGLSQNNAYGDNYQGETNYPLVRLTSVADGSVHYAFTHDESTHSIAPHTFGHTKFDFPALTRGLYDFVAVTNRIASNSIRVNVLAGAD